MLSFGVAMVVSVLVSLGILRLAYYTQRFGMDADIGDPRRVHVRPVPRIGGLAVVLALALGNIAVLVRSTDIGMGNLMLLAAALPAFVGGFVEDLTGRVHPRLRMVLMGASVLTGVMLFDLRITRVDLPLLDPLFEYRWFSVALTMLGMLTITNGINLIDGLNGLAGMVCLVMFCGLAIVGLQVGDPLIVSASLLTAGAIVGFQFWNYPRAHLFLGDGGAYLLGFLLGALSILLVTRNPGVSAWFAPLLLAYPLLEVAFSIWRRKIMRGDASGLPDAAHLHHLIYRRVVRWAVGSEEPDFREQRNAFASPYLWVLSSLAVAPAVIFHNRGWVLIAFLILFVVTYVWLYTRIARMRVPRWLILRGEGDADTKDAAAPEDGDDGTGPAP